MKLCYASDLLLARKTFFGHRAQGPAFDDLFSGVYPGGVQVFMQGLVFSFRLLAKL